MLGHLVVVVVAVGIEQAGSVEHGADAGGETVEERPPGRERIGGPLGLRGRRYDQFLPRLMKEEPGEFFDERSDRCARLLNLDTNERFEVWFHGATSGRPHGEMAGDIGVEGALRRCRLGKLSEHARHRRRRLVRLVWRPCIVSIFWRRTVGAGKWIARKRIGRKFVVARARSHGVRLGPRSPAAIRPIPIPGQHSVKPSVTD